MMSLGEKIGISLRGGEVIELVGDVGAGKTTLVKGLAKGLKIADPIQSPTFTISRVYAARDGLQLAHYDFYRLAEAGIMGEEIDEVSSKEDTVTVVEWSDAVEDRLPGDRLVIKISADSENTRILNISSLGERSKDFLSEVL